MKMENQNERNGECVKPFDFLAQDKERSSENLEDSDNLCTFVAPKPQKPLNDAQMWGSFYFRTLRSVFWVPMALRLQPSE